MLTREFVEKFFMLHGVTPEKPDAGFDQYYRMIVAASQAEEDSFSKFVHEALLHGNKLRLNFESWDELWNCYRSFMAGYIGSH